MLVMENDIMKQQLDIEMLKQECRDRGMHTTEIPQPQIHLDQEELSRKLNVYSHILDITSHYLNEFVLSLNDTPLLAVIADNEGDIIRIQGNDLIKSMVESTGLKQGVRFTEEHNGINVINLALRYKKPIALIGEQHYHEFLHQSACYSVPIIDIKTDKVIGVVALMTAKDFANPILLSLLSSVNNSIEREIKLVNEKNRLNLINQIIIDTTNVGILILDNVGNIIDFNTYAKNLTKATTEQVVGKNILDLASRKYSSVIKDILYNHKSFTDMEATILIKGEEITLLCDALPIKYKGEFIGSFIQLRDITEHKKAQSILIKDKKDAERANKEKTNFLSSMSHELRTPLNAIYGFSHLLNMNVDDTLTEVEKMYVGEIHSASKHMLTIVNDLLSLSEVEAGRFGLNETSISLNTLVEECMKMVSHYDYDKNITIVNELESDLPKVNADYTRLKQVMINILSNAIKYNCKNGYIYIRSKSIDEYIELTVKDTGIGIKAEEIGKVFDKFYRTSQSRNIIEGSGIGLAISRQLIEKMGGTITVDSKLDEGSIFTLTLKKAEQIES